MFNLFMIVVFVLVGAIVPRFTPFDNTGKNVIRGVCALLALFFFIHLSVVIVGKHEVGHLDRVYFGKNMPNDRVIAMPDEKGPQARTLTAGFHFLPFIRLTHDIEMLPTIVVPEGKCAYIVAKDGAPLPDNTYFAPKWDNRDDMVDALKFMGWTDDRDTYNGPKGMQGPQLTVLPPAEYRINRYIFEVYALNAVDVPIGRVAVVKANAGKDYTGSPILPDGVEYTNLSVPIVPKGYIGVWNTSLKPGRYYLNTKAYNVTIIPTQIQTWKYLGGYTRRYIDLVLSNNGQITQTARSEQVAVPKGAADSAVALKVEGWDVFQDARIQVQVTPENAPFVVAAAGNIDAIEDKIMTPTFRSVLRNEVAKELPEEVPDPNDPEKTITKTRPREVLDLLYKREGLEKAVESKLIPEGAKVGLTVMEVRFGDPVVPPELLIPGKRKQLAENLVSTYRQEQFAQVERVKTEKERARADQQGELMRSEIGIKVADNQALAKEKLGIGERKYMENVAKGQEAQAIVLGKDKAFELEYVKALLATAKENPDIIKVPHVFVMGENGGGLSGAAAILGANNLSLGLKTRNAPQVQAAE